MTRHMSSQAFQGPIVSTVLVEAARCWKGARARREAAQPVLSIALGEHDCTLLAPVLDSLYLLFEQALGRRMITGDTLTLSSDEHLLLSLLDSLDPPCLDCPTGARTALHCALCSTRIMMTLVLADPTERAQP